MLACLIFTSLCVTALLLGRRSSDARGRIVAGMVAALCMLPCRILLPRLYKSANAPLNDEWTPLRAIKDWAATRGPRKKSKWRASILGMLTGALHKGAVAPAGPVAADSSSGKTSEQGVTVAAMEERRMRITTVIKVWGGGTPCTGDACTCGKGPPGGGVAETCGC